MARTYRTAEQFEAVAKQLSDSAQALIDIASSMRESQLPEALVHVTLPENTHLPAIIDWIDKLKIDVRSQVRAFQSNAKSNAERRKQSYEIEKLAAARKKAPGKKKG